MRFSILVELELVEMMVFVEGGKLENPEKNPRSKTRAKTKNKKRVVK